VSFKAWAVTGDMALLPVTIVLGTNSSGKSSLIQSLLLLKQTVLSPDRSKQARGGAAGAVWHRLSPYRLVSEPIKTDGRRLTIESGRC
jgi:AAA15 family ATPase/GTPase